MRALHRIALFTIFCQWLPQCAGRGSLNLAPDTASLPPIDTGADQPRSETEFLFSELTDVAADIPRTVDNFNFKTFVDTEVSLSLRFYDGINPVQISGPAVILFRDAAGRTLWAGTTDNSGRLNGSMAVPAATGQVTLYVYKDRFGERTVSIENLGGIRKIDRSLFVQRTSGVSQSVNFSRAGQGQISQKASTQKPAMNLSGSQLSLIDNNADGVPDAFDDFPFDHERAFKVKIPADQYFTISFEDLFPVVGDGDYNDFIGRYGVTHVLNGQKQIVEITGSADAIARLAGYRHRFSLVIRFPGYSATLDTHKAGAACDANGFPWAMLVPSNYKYPKEGMFIENAYPHFKQWRESLGQTNADWYNFPVESRVVAQPVINTCTAALRIESIIPANNEGLLPLNTVVRAFFNQSIDARTVNYQAVQILAGNTAFTGQLAVNANEILFTPTYELVRGTSYTFRITPQVKSVTGDSLMGDHTSVFSTELNARASAVRELDIYTEGTGSVFVFSGSDFSLPPAKPVLAPSSGNQMEAITVRYRSEIFLAANLHLNRRIL